MSRKRHDVGAEAARLAGQPAGTESNQGFRRINEFQRDFFISPSVSDLVTPGKSPYGKSGLSGLKTFHVEGGIYASTESASDLVDFRLV